MSCKLRAWHTVIIRCLSRSSWTSGNTWPSLSIQKCVSGCRTSCASNLVTSGTVLGRVFSRTCSTLRSRVHKFCWETGASWNTSIVGIKLESGVAFKAFVSIWGKVPDAVIAVCRTGSGLTLAHVERIGLQIQSCGENTWCTNTVVKSVTC